MGSFENFSPQVAPTSAGEALLEQTLADDVVSFRMFLQQELLRRHRANPRYSLRSFARFLEINPSTLSRILREHRSVSRPLLRKLALKLGVGPERVQIFTQNLPKRKSPIRKEMSAIDFQQLTIDTFAVISDWYHFAILELSNLQHFESNARFISKALGISPADATAAVDRLFRLGFLRENEAGRWYNVSGNNSAISDDLRASAYQNLQKQLLEKAIRAMEDVPQEKRDQSSMTMSIDSHRLPEAIRRITRFRRELCAYLEQGEQRDSVYNLSISLFPLTQIEKEVVHEQV